MVLRGGGGGREAEVRERQGAAEAASVLVSLWRCSPGPQVCASRGEVGAARGEARAAGAVNAGVATRPIHARALSARAVARARSREPERSPRVGFASHLVGNWQIQKSQTTLSTAARDGSPLRRSKRARRRMRVHLLNLFMYPRACRPVPQGESPRPRTGSFAFLSRTMTSMMTSKASATMTHRVAEVRHPPRLPLASSFASRQARIGRAGSGSLLHVCRKLTAAFFFLPTRRRATLSSRANQVHANFCSFLLPSRKPLPICPPVELC